MNYNIIYTVLTLLLTSLQPLLAIPLRGNYPWTMVLCKFYDVPKEPKPGSYFYYWMFDKKNHGSVANYFKDISNNLYKIDGSSVHGWFTMQYRKQAIKFLANTDKNMDKLYGKGSADLKYYHKTKELCLQTAKTNGVRPHRNVIVIINDDNMAMFCSEEGILLTPKYYATSALAHEMVHSFHIGHSYSDRHVRIYPYSTIGEYDDVYDLMSTANAYMYPTLYGFNGPGLNGPHLDYLGWLPMDRVKYFGRDGKTSQTLKLSSISLPHKGSTGWLLVQLPYDRDDPQNMYTVELRTKSKHDQGIKRDAILIHKLKTGREGHLFSYLITNDLRRRHEWLPGETWTVFLSSNTSNLIQVSILNMDTRRGTAEIRVRSTFSPIGCKKREFKRDAFPGDEVCVIRTDKRIIDASAGNAPRLTDRNGTCLNNTVRRKSIPSDITCVSKAVKQLIQLQNHRWKNYKHFYEGLSWGLNSCQAGYLWRNIDAYDYTCVTAEEQALAFTQTRRDCKTRHVSRNAFPGDRACVTRKERIAAQRIAWKGRLKLTYRKFFNGVDKV